MSTGITQTTFVFTVLHRTDEPFDPYGMGGGFYHAYDSELGQAMQRSFDGHAVGRETVVSQTEFMEPKSVRDHLIAMGNDGTFFDEDMDKSSSDELV